MARQEKLDVNEIVTNRILEQLKAGTVPWHKPWAGGFQMPRNLVSGKEYRGINVWLLTSAGFASPYWLTYKQAEAKGGNVKKGEKGSLVVLWTTFKTNDKATGEEKTIPVMRYYTVFNATQCENIEVPVIETRNSGDAIEACEEVVHGYKNAPKVNHGATSAYYSPKDDAVTLPDPKSFDTMEHYYSTKFHELVHSTGHETRLKRPGIVDFDAFGSHQYSQEELIAEMGAAFLAAHVGMTSQAVSDNSAAYIGNWINKLQNDHKFIVKAASAAQKALDLILGTKFESEEKAA